MRAISVIWIALAGCVAQPPPAAPAPPPEHVATQSSTGFAQPPPGDPEDGPQDWQPPPADAGPPPPDAAVDPAVLQRQGREARWARLEADAIANPGTLVGMATSTQVVRCGGAAPPPGAPYSVSGPWGGDIIVRKGSKNSRRKPVAVVRTGQHGVFSVDLKPGTYCLVQSAKKDPPKKGAGGMYTDVACLRQRWQTCDAVVEHPSNKAVGMNVFRPCFGPCYHGPMPP